MLYSQFLNTLLATYICADITAEDDKYIRDFKKQIIQRAVESTQDLWTKAIGCRGPWGEYCLKQNFYWITRPVYATKRLSLLD